MQQQLTRVIRDQATNSWRVICPVHGPLASYRNFWVASRDARQHESTHEEADPEPSRGAARAG